jgi:hypothetical protein
LSGLTSLKLGSIGAQLGELVNEFSSDDTLSGNSNTAVPTEKAVKQYFGKVSSNVVPSVDNLYTLGTSSKRWEHVYVGPGSITIGTLTITDNAGALEVKAGANVAPTNIDSINNGTSNVSVVEDGSVTITAGGNLGLTINSSGDAQFEGNVTINGGTVTLSSTEITIEDAMIQLADANPANLLDIGLFGHFTSGTLQHTGLVRDASDNTWKLFSNVLTNPSTTVDFTDAVYDPLRMGALTSAGITASGTVAINASGGITTDQTTFPLVNTTATTVNFAGAATALNMGASSGTTTVNNDVNIPTGKVFKINSTTVLSGTQVLGKSIGGTGTGDIVSIDATQTLTNKTLTSPDINGGTLSGLTELAIRDTSAAYDVTVAAISSVTLTASRILTVDMTNAARTIKLAGNIDLGGTLTTAGAFSTSGAYGVTLTATGTTNVTLPTSGTLLTTTTGASTGKAIAMSMVFG